MASFIDDLAPTQKNLFPFPVGRVFVFPTALRGQFIQPTCNLRLQLSASRRVGPVTRLPASWPHDAIPSDRRSRLAPSLVATAVGFGDVMAQAERAAAVRARLAEH